jgi:hypothetical protein
MTDLMSSPGERHRQEKQHQADVLALTVAQEAYEFARMQVVDEIARFLQSKNPSSWGINVTQALKNVESDWDAARNKAAERAKVPLFWDLFVCGHAASVRRYVILATTNAEVKPYNKMLADLHDHYFQAQKN